jgi:hypothetical protein
MAPPQGAFPRVLVPRPEGLGYCLGPLRGLGALPSNALWQAQAPPRAWKSEKNALESTQLGRAGSPTFAKASAFAKAAADRSAGRVGGGPSRHAEPAGFWLAAHVSAGGSEIRPY